MQLCIALDFPQGLETIFKRLDMTRADSTREFGQMLEYAARYGQSKTLPVLLEYGKVQMEFRVKLKLRSVPFLLLQHASTYRATWVGEIESSNPICKDRYLKKFLK